MGGSRTKPSRATLGALSVLCAFIAMGAIAYAVAGSLTFVERDKEGVDGVAGMNDAIGVAVSPDGAHVYVVSLGSSAVVTFSRATPSGALTFVEQDVDGVSGVDGIGSARSVTVSPDGKYVYVTGSADSAVATFSRNESSGALTFVEQDKDGVDGVDGLLGAWGVEVSPDGKHVYVASDIDHAVATFSRNESTGALTFVEQDKDGVDGVDGLSIAAGVAASPSGSHVYVTSCGDHAVATFSRNATSGALTFVEQDKDGVDGVDGLACARGVAVDASGTSVYVAGESDDSVATFSRDETSGALSFVDVEKDGVGGVDGLNGARDVAVTPDCSTVYAASAVDDAVTTFSRDAATGALTFIEQDKDGVDGVDGVDQSVGVAVSPNGAHGYATGELDDAVATFSREQPSSSLCGTPPPGGGGPADRTITLTASKKKVKRGKKVTLSGDLSAPQGAESCESGQTVTLQRQVGKRAFKPRSELTTGPSGSFTSKQKVKKTSRFRAVVGASSTCKSAESPARKVKTKKRKRRK